MGIVSESGTPILSDPGYTVVSVAIKNGVKVVSIPGPTAFINALVGYDVFVISIQYNQIIWLCVKHHDLKMFDMKDAALHQR